MRLFWAGMKAHDWKDGTHSIRQAAVKSSSAGTEAHGERLGNFWLGTTPSKQMGMNVGRQETIYLYQPYLLRAGFPAGNIKTALSWPSAALMEVRQPCKFSWINFEK